MSLVIVFQLCDGQKSKNQKQPFYFLFFKYPLDRVLVSDTARLGHMGEINTTPFLKETRSHMVLALDRSSNICSVTIQNFKPEVLSLVYIHIQSNLNVSKFYTQTDNPCFQDEKSLKKKSLTTQ